MIPPTQSRLISIGLPISKSYPAYEYILYIATCTICILISNMPCVSTYTLCANQFRCWNVLQRSFAATFVSFRPQHVDVHMCGCECVHDEPTQTNAMTTSLAAIQYGVHVYDDRGGVYGDVNADIRHAAVRHFSNDNFVRWRAHGMKALSDIILLPPICLCSVRRNIRSQQNIISAVNNNANNNKNRPYRHSLIYLISVSLLIFWYGSQYRTNSQFQI